MAINRTSISAQDITQDPSFSIKLASTRPDTTAYLSTPVEPNVMIGFYDSTLNAVQLYVTDPTGRRYIKVL
jgi:hypothetical protein